MTRPSEGSRSSCFAVRVQGFHCLGVRVWYIGLRFEVGGPHREVEPDRDPQRVNNLLAVSDSGNEVQGLRFRGQGSRGFPSTQEFGTGWVRHVHHTHTYRGTPGRLSPGLGGLFEARRARYAASPSQRGEGEAEGEMIESKSYLSPNPEL